MKNKKKVSPVTKPVEKGLSSEETQEILQVLMKRKADKAEREIKVVLAKYNVRFNIVHTVEILPVKRQVVPTVVTEPKYKKK